MNHTKIVIIIIFIISFFLCYRKDNFIDIINVSSDSIENNNFNIRNVCEDRGGANYSPHLSWLNINDDKIKSYALLCEDLDAPHDRDNNWTHWLIPNIEIPSGVETIHLPEVITNGVKEMRVGSRQFKIKNGINSWNKIGYRGLCPHLGFTHNYKITIYALSIVISNSHTYTRNTFLSKINGKVLYQGSITGRFLKPKEAL